VQFEQSFPNLALHRGLNPLYNAKEAGFWGTDW
jgi:hypothetical protein